MVYRMEKILALAFAIFFALSLAACSADIVAIEDYEWKMRTVMNNKEIEEAQSEDELVVAVGEADEVHPNAKVIDITMVAKNGEITVKDMTNNKTYSGSYKVQQKTPKGTDYEITIDGIKGYATVAPTEYYDGSELPTLPISLGGYSLYFIPVK